LKNVDKYPEILQGNYNLDSNFDEKLESLVTVFSSRENYFGITSVDEVSDYENIKSNICKKILRGEASIDLISKIMKTDEEVPLQDAQKFAYLEIVYGMDLQDAKNLVMKYGKDIEKLDLEPKFEYYLDIIKDLQNVLDSDDFEKTYLSKEKIDALSKANVGTVSQMEADLLNIYAKTYRDAIYKVDEKELAFKDEFEGKNIDVIEMDPKSDFSMFARVEGAFVEWEEPDNFLDAINVPNTKYHGNCKSFIAQNMLAIARPKGPIWGYSKTSDNSLLLGAPWDIFSVDANQEFSTASVDWNYEKGVSFRIPEEMINNTRDTHNEFVSDRLMFNNETMQYEKDKPQYVIFFKESTDEDYKLTDAWRVTKKAASQVGVPIVIIDKEKVFLNQLEKINKLEEILFGNMPNDTDLTEEQIIEKLVVEFENNKVGANFSDKLKDKYFTVEQRTVLHNSIINKINLFKEINPAKYESLRNAYEKAMENEIEKQFSSTGTTIGNSQTINSFIGNLSNFKNGKLDLNLDEEKKRTILEFIENISSTHFYDDNEYHSIEHIQKVILFSGMLASFERINFRANEIIISLCCVS
jgi:hypothetical protein